ncbi:MAG TPA: Gfo/Idh/MocA family oxidoreductase [Candidatus Acidoferrum sp.]|nr:Gfo/Idh/MocA family oxidoreductase [Candidatus Acidoferrum sp.]
MGELKRLNNTATGNEIGAGQIANGNEAAMSGVSRREFLGKTASAAAGFTIVPRHVLGGAGYVPPSDKVNIAFIGVGAQGLRVMLHFLKEQDVQGVAVCDVNKSSDNYPQWDDHEFTKSVHKLLGVDSGWEWLSPNEPIQLSHTLRVTGGVAGREPCQKIVDALYATQTRSGNYKGCAAYVDFRELLEKQKDVDAVVVCTTDNLHAAVSIAAMKKGKHVFCQKPLTHTIYEARRMAEVARETGVATQIAVGNQASEATRLLCEWIWDGAIGPVREVHNWSNRPFWPQGVERPKETQPVPAGLDWDLWLGPAPERAYNQAYLPFVWRGWGDFGCGALGDMGSYSFDTIFRVLKLDAPDSIEASSSDRYDETYPLASICRYSFPARGNMPPVKFTWYDGGLKPGRPEELEETRSLTDLDEEGEGLLFSGDHGKILCGFNGSDPKIIPQAKMDAYKQPPKTLPRSPGNEREWLNACKGDKTKAGGNFEFSGVVTESLLLGNVASRTGQRLHWDRTQLKVTNSEAAQKLVKPDRRKGWEI